MIVNTICLSDKATTIDSSKNWLSEWVARWKICYANYDERHFILIISTNHV